ncbi:PiggyBac transposable element-derived protein 4 [Araneus ventricosus]|uniref:PiggyBac transposable element-derived protein 4 n=2 Tax=Araneus ventricosus TaxID=182803 RepID=A0A4Y2KUL3_ARAVE|nr:PiggyBac transposable element-derived protein 4 [Araneus ventricosus]
MSEERFSELYADVLSDCPSDVEFSDSDSDDSDIRPSKRQRRILSDSEADSDEEWNDIDIVPSLEDYSRNSRVPNFECDPPSIVDVIDSFFDEEFFNLVVSQTNLYHTQMKDLHKNSAKTLQWKEVTTNDMKKFLGLLVLMGQTKKTCWRDYWSTDPLVEIPIFPKTMSRMRFEQIFTFFHLSDNVENVLSTDRLYKIRPLLDYVISKSQSMYVPKQQLSLDEAMIPWRGRLKFKTYNPAKITKYGILVRMVCESESGYICNFEVYSGVGKKLEETILSILQPYFGFNHHMYQDNYYNNVSTASILLENKIRVCGTIRENRGLPKLLIEKSKNLQRRQMTFLRKGPILLLTWKDKRLVRMISTIHDASMITIGNRNKNYINDKIKPSCIIEYNKYMKGVDRADQYLANSSILRKSIKWSKKTAFFFINCLLFNAFVIYSKKCQNKIRYKKFLLEVARIWLSSESIESNTQPANTSHASKRAPHKDPVSRLSGKLLDHVLEPIITASKTNPTRKCRVCSSKGKRSETRYICKTCCVPLHVGECFNFYHTKKNY